MNGCNGMQMEGRLNQPVRCRLDSRLRSGQQHAVTYLQMSATLPLFLMDVSRCADADPSLLETRRELMIMSHPPTSPKPLPGAWLFVQDSSPFCKATGDPWPPLHRTPGLNPNSYILMSCVQPCPPPDTLPDKDTCVLPVILSFSEFCVGDKTPAGH